MAGPVDDMREAAADYKAAADKSRRNQWLVPLAILAVLFAARGK
jgi:hypothetical protein